jgi:dTDP-4-amino-4,6-dideoxygalactose transaminase
MSSTYEHVDLGFNFRMTPLEAALGIAQLRKIDHFMKVREKIAQRYLSHLGKILSFPTIMPYVTKLSWGTFLVLANSKDKRDNLVKHLFAKGIEARVMWKPVHLQQYHRRFAKSRYPIAEMIFRRVVSLPIGNGMSPEATDYTISTIKNFLEQT